MTCARQRRLAAVRISTCLLGLVVSLGIAAQEIWRPVAATSVQPGPRAGRVNVALPDPRDANVMYIGTDGGRPTAKNGGNLQGRMVVGLPDTGGGGVWKTVDWLADNPHWTPLTDAMGSLAVGPNGLVAAPTAPDVLYAAADGPQGAILKSVDAGAHWEAFGSDRFANVKFGGIAVSPVNADLVYVAVFRGDAQTPGGVYVSYDGARSFMLAGGMAGDVSHVAVDPAIDGVLYAGFVDPADPARQGAYKSTDYGNTWTRLTGFPAGAFDSTLFIEFALAPSQPQTVYAVVMTPANQPLPKFYASRNGGANWERLCNTASDPDNRYWHQPLAVHPFAPEVVYAEGFNHIGMMTRTGGRPILGSDGKPTCEGVWRVFWTGDDPAAIAFYLDPSSSDGVALAAVGDRGIYRVVNTLDPVEKLDFSHKQGDLANLLLVSIAANPFADDDLRGIAVDQLAGLRTSPATGTAWRYLDVGGEFGKFLFHPRTPGVEYNLRPAQEQKDGGGESLTFPPLARSADGGVTWQRIDAGFEPRDFPFAKGVITDAAAWKALEFDWGKDEGLLFGALQVFAWEPGRPWQAISPVLVTVDPTPGATISFISALAVARNAPQRVYVGTSEGKLFVTHDRSTWTAVSGLPLPADAFVARISVDPAYADNAVIAVQGTYGAGRLWVTNDGGAHWTDMTRDLPPGLAVYTVAADWAQNGARLYAGTDRGVFVTSLWPHAPGAMSVDTSMVRWTRSNAGLPNTLVTDLEISPTRVLTAATLGRGAYRTSLPPPP